DDVLDIGCGCGEFLAYVRCATRTGVDLVAPGPGALPEDVRFHQGDVGVLERLQQGSFSFVFTSNFLEHMADKRQVADLVRRVWRLLKPGGYFVVMGPNLRFIPGEYWDFWDHHVPITDRSLVELLQNSKFSLVDCRPCFLPYTTKSRLPKADWLVRAYLHMPWAWRLLGKQFLVRARKEMQND
ncbi:MAG: class I SAM-dependent methyltransferase, partial [Thermoguttaceae bacterium]